MTAAKVVMVVDDDEALRESVCELLEDEGYEAVSADNGARALERLHSAGQKPDLILLDLMMPVMNGWQFREGQLQDPSLASIPVVVMTAGRDVRGISADEVVYKPLKLRRLLEVVERHSGRDAMPEAPELQTSNSAIDAKVGTKATPNTTENAEALNSAELLLGGGEMGARMRAFDWSTSPLGNVSTWPQSLRSAVSICLGSRFPIAIYWGRELTTLYNDGWSTIPGTKHPGALGRPAKEVWPEIWSTISGWFERVVATGESIYQEGQFLAMHRHGYTEECYFDFTFSPIRAESGGVEGVFNAVIETTFRSINERRTRVLRDLGEALAPARTAADACMLAAEVLGSASQDVPFCALYLTLGDDASLAHLAASARLPAGSPAAPHTIALNNDAGWPLRQARDSGRVEVVNGLTARLGLELSGGAWPEPADAAFVAPLVAIGSVCGFLVLGVNPRRAVDDDYLLFVERAAAHVASAIATALDYEHERKRAEALAEVDRAKTTFFSNVSHEFRTPLTLMLGPTGDLLSGVYGELADTQREQLEVLHRNGLRLQKLVKALLDFSRLEAGRAQASYEPVDLSKLTRELASAFDTAIERARLKLVIDCPPLDEPIYVDRDMWETIVLNLLSNALKFTFEGSIEVSLRSLDGNVALRVTDSGVGVAPSELPRLFERFHRIESARARTHEGSGIGLALVQELARLHGGTVQAESELAVGTTFTVTIPKGNAHLAKERVGAAHAAASTAARVGTAARAAPFVQEALRWLPQEPKTAPSAPPPDTTAEDAALAGTLASKTAARAARILLADDNRDMRNYVRRHLERYWTVEAVGDGAEALAAAQSNPPDLILTDVMMPGLDGFALLRELRKDARTNSIPVIMLSARAGEEAKIDGLQAGAEDYLTKPFSARELLARVRTHLELARLRKEMRAEREQLFSLLMQAPVPICLFYRPELGSARDSELVFELANPLYDELAGRKILLGRTALEVFPEICGQGFDDLMSGVLRTGEPHVSKEVLVRLDRDHDGVLEDAFFTFTYAPIRSESGVVDRVMAVVHDVTHQVTARRLVERSEESFRGLVLQVQAGIAETDLTGRFTMTNERYRELVGRSAAELTQLRLQDLAHPHDLPGILEQLQNLVNLGSPFVVEQRYVKPDGSVVWVQNSGSRIDDREGHPYRIATITIDITQRKYAELASRESEERYRTLVGQVKDYAIFRAATEGRATTWNEGVGRVLGFDEGEFIGLDIREAIFTPEDVRAGVPELELETAAREGTANNDRWMQRKSGERFAAAGVTSALRDAGGRLLGFTKVMRDQTERVKAEEEAARLAAIVTSSEDAIISQDLTGTVQTWNKGAEHLFGYAAEEVIGKSVTLLIPENRADEEPRMLACTERGEIVQHYETVRRRKDGRLLDVSLTVSPVRDAAGRVLGAAKIVRDITERKRLEAEREARVAEALQALKFSERFVGILGHDLRNPLGAITTASDLLLRRETSERLVRPLQRIHASAERMTRMIEQILDLTRARIGGGIPLEPTAVDLEELAKPLVEELQIAVPRQIVLEPLGDLAGEWDGDRLAQVISNLLGNAVEHGEANEPVRLKLNGAEPDVVYLSVWNAGVVAEKLLPTLFDPFRGAATEGVAQKSKGLGLGLYIVREIVEAHGGSIEVRSSASEGTTFSVSLPRRALASGKTSQALESPRAMPSASAAPRPGS